MSRSTAEPPGREGWHLPAEWAPHRACWLAWPAHPAEWPGVLDEVRARWLELAAAVAAEGDDGTAGEALEVLVPDAAHEAEARRALASVGRAARWWRIPYGDVWTRDVLPLFLAGGPAASPLAASFRFDGWGGRCPLPHDPEVSEAVARARELPWRRADLVLEGGAVDVDGEGTALASRSCLLDRARYGAVDEATQENRLRDWLGVRSVVWLDGALAGDHTGGHVDLLARFVAPGRVLCERPGGAADPNAGVHDAVRRRLHEARDAAGRRLEVVELPPAPRVEDASGRPLPASRLNLYVANAAVVVPAFGDPAEAGALQRLEALFPERRVVPIEARTLVLGGGAHHCITQQEPRP